MTGMSNDEKLKRLKEMVHLSRVPDSVKPALYSVIGNRFSDVLPPAVTVKYKASMMASGNPCKYYSHVVHAPTSIIFDIYTHIKLETIKSWADVPIKNVKFNDESLKFY